MTSGIENKELAVYIDVSKKSNEEIVSLITDMCQDSGTRFVGFFRECLYFTINRTISTVLTSDEDVRKFCHINYIVSHAAIALLLMYRNMYEADIQEIVKFAVAIANLDSKSVDVGIMAEAIHYYRLDHDLIGSAKDRYEEVKRNVV